jgi:hypothetical protein
MTGTVPTSVQDTHHPQDDRYSTDWCTGYTPPTGYKYSASESAQAYIPHVRMTTVKSTARLDER